MLELLSSQRRLILENEVGQQFEHVFSPAENSFQTLVDVRRAERGLDVLGPTEMSF